MTRTLIAALVLVGLAGASALADTSRMGLRYGNTADGNRNLDIIDRSLPLAGSGFVTQIVFCGDLVNNTTTYLGPPAQWGSNEIAGTACSAADSTTEATADAPPLGTSALITVMSMFCRVTSSGSNGVAFQLRDNTASVSGATCTIATGQTQCVWKASSVSARPQIPAGDPMAVRAITTEDLSTADAHCVVTAEVQ